MSAATAWALAGLAVVAFPSASRVDAPSRSSDRLADEPTVPLAKTLPGLAVAAVGGACVAALGLPAGVVVAALLCPAVAALLIVVQRRPVPVPPDAALPLTLDLVAAALRSGQPLPDALSLAARAARADIAHTMHRVAGLLRLGAEPMQAWSVGARAGPLSPVAVVAVRSAASGIKLAGAFERLADDLRADRSAAATARAHRAGIVAMAPLAACFLPAFVCLGVVPVVVGLTRTAVGVVP